MFFQFEIFDLLYDVFLCEDVSWIGVMVGQMLVEQCGEVFFEWVEVVCISVICCCCEGELVVLFGCSLSGMQLDEVEVLVCVFVIYFQVVNIVECVYCICCCCDYQCVGGVLQFEFLLDVFVVFKVQGVIVDELFDWFGCLYIELVFIVYFIEVVCCLLLEKEQVIVCLLVDNFDFICMLQECKEDDDCIFMVFFVGWQIVEVLLVQFIVQDEYYYVGFYFVNLIYCIVLVLYEVLVEVLQQVYGVVVLMLWLLSFVIWVGGDMDGNFNVGVDIIVVSLVSQCVYVFEYYMEDVVGLVCLFSQMQGCVVVDLQFIVWLDDYCVCFSVVVKKICLCYVDMFYCILFILIGVWLEVSFEDDYVEGYISVDELVGDFECIVYSLIVYYGLYVGVYVV